MIRKRPQILKYVHSQQRIVIMCSHALIQHGNFYGNKYDNYLYNIRVDITNSSSTNVIHRLNRISSNPPEKKSSQMNSNHDIDELHYYNKAWCKQGDSQRDNGTRIYDCMDISKKMYIDDHRLDI